MLGCFFIQPAFAQVDELEVIFNPDPLFSQANFAPGQAVTANINVTNNTDAVQPIAIEAINVNDPDNLGSALTIEISQGTSQVYTGSLADFFSAGEVYLSNLNSLANTTYNVEVTFSETAGNDWQGKVLNSFDVLVGFLGEMPPPPPPPPAPSGGGGGGGGITHGLSIFDEAEFEVTDTTATISWRTNYFSTSRVVYSQESEPHDFNISDLPNYGYAHSSVEDTNKVTAHTVVLTDLEPNTTYYYRVISHASPATVSLQHTFTTLGSVAEEEVAEDLEIPQESDEPRTESGGQTDQTSAESYPVSEGEFGSGESQDGSGQSSDNNQPIITVDDSGQGGENQEQDGQVAGTEDQRDWPWWLVLLIVVDYLVLLSLNYFAKSSTQTKRWFAILLAALPMIAVIFCTGLAWWIWFLLVIMYLMTLIAYVAKAESDSVVSVLLTMLVIIVLIILRQYLA